MLDYQELMNGFTSGSCEAIVGMVLDKAVATNFTMSPAFSVTDTDYIVTLHGSYSVSLVGASSPFLQVDLPDLPIKIDKQESFTLTHLPDKISTTIEQSAAAIVGKILADPAKLATFIATVGLVDAAPKLLADLACNGAETVESADVAAAAEAAEAAAKLAQSTAETATTAADAAAAAADALLAGGSGTEPPNARPLGAPRIAGFMVDRANLVVTWQVVPDAAAYRIDLVHGNSVVDTTHAQRTTLRAQFMLDGRSAGSYTARVTANAPHRASASADSSAVEVLAAVASVTLVIDGTTIGATWAGGAAPYEARVAVDGTVIPLDVTVGDGTGHFTPSRPGRYTMRVRAKGDQTHARSTWSPPSNDIVMADVAAVTMSIEGNSFRASWDDLAAPGYEIVVYNGDQEFVGDTASGTTYAFQPGSAGLYTAKVRATGDRRHVAGGWSAPSNPVVMPSQPVVTATYNFDNEVLQASWTAAGPSPHPANVVELTREGREIQTVTVNESATTFRLGGPGQYTVRVRQQGDTTHLESPVGESAAVRVALPLTVGLRYDDGQLVAEWNDVHPPNYDVRLLWNGAEVTSTTTATTTSFSPMSHPDGGTFTVRAKANSRDHFVGGGWSDPSPGVEQLAGPEHVTAATQDGRRIVVTATSSVDAFRAQLISPGFLRPDNPVADGTQREPASLDPSGLGAGAYSVRGQAMPMSSSAGQIPSAWVRSEAQVFILAPPTVTTFDRNDPQHPEVCRIGMDGVDPNATRYDVRFTSLDGAHHCFQSGELSGTTLEVSAEELVPGKYTVEVRVGRTATDGIDSPWARSSSSITVTDDGPQVPEIPKMSLRLHPQTDDCAVIPLQTPIHLDDFTVEVWVKLSDENLDHATIFASEQGFSLSVVAGTVIVAIDLLAAWKADTLYWKSDVQPGLQGHGAWHLISAVYHNREVKVFLDGSSIGGHASGQRSPDQVVCTDRIVVGGYDPTSTDMSYRFSGLLSEIRLWTVARDVADIGRAMHTTLDPVQEPDLSMYYDFRGGTGDELTGRSGDSMKLLGQARIVDTDVPVSRQAPR